MFTIIIEFLKRFLWVPFLLPLIPLFKSQPAISIGIFLVTYVLRKIFNLKGSDATIGIVIVLGVFSAWAYYRSGLTFAVLKDGFTFAFWAMGFYQLYKLVKFIYEKISKKYS